MSIIMTLMYLQASQQVPTVGKYLKLMLLTHGHDGHYYTTEEVVSGDNKCEVDDIHVVVGCLVPQLVVISGWVAWCRLC